METQNIEVTFHSLLMSAQKAQHQSPALVERLNRDPAGCAAARRRPRSDRPRSVIPADHNTDIDAELLEGMHGPNDKRNATQPRAMDGESAYYPAPTKASEKLPRKLRAHRFAVQRPVRDSIAWMAAILAIVGILTALLMTGIAISV